MSDPHVYPHYDDWKVAYYSGLDSVIKVPVETAFEASYIWATVPWLVSSFELALNAADLTKFYVALLQINSGHRPSDARVLLGNDPGVAPALISSPLPGLSVTWWEARKSREDANHPIFATLTQSPERRRADAQGNPALAQWRRDVARLLQTL